MRAVHQPQSASRLLSLPPEVRNSTYECALYTSRDTVSLDKPFLIRDDWEIYASRLTLLRSCRQVNHEASGLFYAMHKIHVGSYMNHPELGRFLRQISLPRLQAILHLSGSITSGEQGAVVLSLLATKSQLLRSLHLGIKLYHQRDANAICSTRKSSLPQMTRSLRQLPSLRCIGIGLAYGGPELCVDHQALSQKEVLERLTAIEAALQGVLDRGAPSESAEMAGSGKGDDLEGQS